MSDSQPESAENPKKVEPFWPFGQAQPVPPAEVGPIIGVAPEATIVSVKVAEAPPVFSHSYTPPPPATSGKYGRIITEKKQLHPGEPVFLLRPTDPDAVDILRDAAARYQLRGCPSEQVSATLAAAKRFEEWQAANPSLVKKAAD